MQLEFYAGVGIENTWMAQHDPAIRPGKRLLDVFLQMQHYEHWKEDLRLAADLGINAIRYSVPWYTANPAPGIYDWDWISRPLDWLTDHDIVPIIDLIHYGTPLWMENGILNHAFPERLAEYATAFARRFRGQVNHYTPLNEPQASAMHSGYSAWFPPYLHGVDGWARVSRPIAEAMVRVSQALRDELPDVTLISADCFMAPEWSEVQRHCSAIPHDENPSALLGFVPASLAYGCIAGDSTLAGCLKQLGFSEHGFDWFCANAQPPDLFGLNYYPFGWPEITHMIETKYQALRTLCLSAHELFQLPIYITETSGGRTESEKILWMNTLETLWQELSRQGVPMRGINWWPLFDAIQWRYRDNTHTVEECIIPGGWNNGLYTIEPKPDGSLSRIATAAVPAYREFVQRGKKGHS